MINRVLSFWKSNKSSQVVSSRSCQIRKGGDHWHDDDAGIHSIPQVTETLRVTTQCNPRQHFARTIWAWKAMYACMHLVLGLSWFVMYRKLVNQCCRVQHGTKCSQDQHTNRNSCWVISSYVFVYRLLQCVRRFAKLQNMLIPLTCQQIHQNTSETVASQRHLETCGDLVWCCMICMIYCICNHVQ